MSSRQFWDLMLVRCKGGCRHQAPAGLQKLVDTERAAAARQVGGDGKPTAIGDLLLALIPGNGGARGDPNALYFTAGVQNEAHGLFGSLTANPMPIRLA